jgi:2-succinyl-5-enolpyruvyl-6-hydroxy-3-cyclohexene-1-carboxylate synthase
LENTHAARALVDGLAAAGARDACVTPGSRSTPLTVAFAEQSLIRPWLHLDERSSAYFALGLARERRSPVALLCTSGTAAANFFPAIVEANLSRIPLVVLTTDRPPALRDVGAAQTVDQLRMYGSHVRASFDASLPSPGRSSQFRTLAIRAVKAASGPLPGPVHLNVPYDEPLIGSPDEHPASPPAGEQFPPLQSVRVPPAGADVLAACRAVASARRPLVVAGPESGGLPATEIAMLARAMDAPVLADPLSGLRTGRDCGEHTIAAYDALLRDRALAESLRPDAVIQFGAAPTSKALNQFLSAAAGPHILCDLPGGFRDPNGAATQLVEGDAAFVAEALAAEVRLTPMPGWRDRWRSLDRAAGAALRQTALSFTDLFEGRVFIELQDLLPDGARLIVGNSMPVRDADSFLGAGDRLLACVGNRGANGIDGVASSALGAAAASAEPAVLVVGDVSLYHDMNGLWAARRHGLNLVIVLVNNNGGGIFHFLPQVAHSAFFEEWFGTPPDLDFRHAAELYGATYSRPGDWESFGDAVRRGLAGGLHVIELQTNRVRNVELHREAWDAALIAARAVDASP